MFVLFLDIWNELDLFSRSVPRRMSRWRHNPTTDVSFSTSPYDPIINEIGHTQTHTNTRRDEGEKKQQEKKNRKQPSKERKRERKVVSGRRRHLRA